MPSNCLISPSSIHPLLREGIYVNTHKIPSIYALFLWMKDKCQSLLNQL